MTHPTGETVYRFEPPTCAACGGTASEWASDCFLCETCVTAIRARRAAQSSAVSWEGWSYIGEPRAVGPDAMEYRCRKVGMHDRRATEPTETLPLTESAARRLWEQQNAAQDSPGDMRAPADLPPLDFVAPRDVVVEYTIPGAPRPRLGPINYGERVVFRPDEYKPGDGSWFLDSKHNCHVSAADVPRIHAELCKLRDEGLPPAHPLRSDTVVTPAALEPLTLCVVHEFSFLSPEGRKTNVPPGGVVTFAPASVGEWRLQMSPPGRVECITGDAVAFLHASLSTLLGTRSVEDVPPRHACACAMCGAPVPAGRVGCVYCVARVQHRSSGLETTIGTVHDDDPLPEGCAWSTATWDEP